MINVGNKKNGGGFEETKRGVRQETEGRQLQGNQDARVSSHVTPFFFFFFLSTFLFFSFSLSFHMNIILLMARLYEIFSFPSSLSFLRQKVLRLKDRQY